MRKPRTAFLALFLLAAFSVPARADDPAVSRFLYVAVPGIRDQLEFGGHGILVFDIDHDLRFVRRIPCGGVDAKGKPMNVKGVCASAVTNRLYVSTDNTLECLDLTTDKLLWERPYEGGCDRMALSPDGKQMYLPSHEKADWHVIDALTGDVRADVVTKSGAHNTIFGPDGKHAYLAGLKSPLLSVSDAADPLSVTTVGPFGNVIRPFTINGSQTLCFVNVNDLLGFEVGDLRSGKVVARVEVSGFKKGPTKRHGCPSHGIAMTPDERELWLADAFNQRVHVFDATVMPPKQVASIGLREQPGWVTMSIDGRLVFPSTGDVIDARSRQVVGHLTDEVGRAVGSEKILEIDFAGGTPSRAGSQFGIGGVTTVAGAK